MKKILLLLACILMIIPLTSATIFDMNDTYDWDRAITWAGQSTTNGTGWGDYGINYTMLTIPNLIYNATVNNVSFDTHGIGAFTAFIQVRFHYINGSFASNSTDNIGGIGAYVNRNITNPFPNMPVWRIEFQTTGANRDVAYLRNIFFKLNYTVPIVLNSPANNTIIAENQTFNATINAEQFFNVNITNATIHIWYSNGTLFNKTTNAITGNITNTTVWNINFNSINNYVWNVQACYVNTTVANFCKFTQPNYTFMTGTSIIGTTYNASTYETVRESLIQNISVPSFASLASIYLIYNGTQYTPTTSLIVSNNYSIVTSLNIPLVSAASAVYNWFYQINYMDGSQQNLTSNNQNVGAINYTICQASPQDLRYLNITFKNETAGLQQTNATITSTWNYWLGTGTVYKTLSFSNTSENGRYSLCFNPKNYTLNANTSISYSNSESQSRTYLASSLSLVNTTSLLTLYLLPSTSGIYSRYRTVDGTGTVIPGVSATVYTTIGGTNTLIASGLTDSSGGIAFFLNPDTTYNYVFSKTGYTDNTFSLTPNSLDTYTVTMSGTSTGISNGTTITTNMSYNSLPSNTTLLNQTSYTFGINATSSNTITFKSYNITNGSGYQLLYGSGSGNGIISNTLNTGTNTTFIGYFVISTSTENITFTRQWVIGNFYEGSYSLYHQLSLFPQYKFSDFIRILLVLAVIIGVMGLMSAGEVIDSTEAKLICLMILMFIASSLHLLDTGITAVTNNSSIATLAQYGSQWGIAIITAMVCSALLLRRLS